MTATVSTSRSATGTTGQSLPGMGGMPPRRDERAEEAPEAGGEQLSRKERRAAERAARKLSGGFEAYPHLLALKPRERYAFRSDYFEVDDSVACVLGFFHDDAAHDDFAPFWGVSRIPDSLGEGVTTVLLEQVRRMSQKWVDEHIRTAEKLDNLEAREQADSGTVTSRRKAAKTSNDVEIASAELLDGASYLHVHDRLLLKARDLESLEAAIERITQLYIDRLGTVRVAPYPGEQRQELTGLTAKNEKKRGKGFHFTSTEYAGSYSLVTNGLNDEAGEYVGYMIGDVNNSAVLLDVDGWDKSVVVADSTIEALMGRAHYPDMWGSKLSQAALLRNRRVVHIVLDGANLDALGPRLDRLTARLDMSHGDINMFEMFGNQADELSIFPAHLDKVALMVEQAYETTDSDRSVIRGSLKETLTQFYIDKGMWYRNAKENRSRLRVVGIPHDQVPLMSDVSTYFETQHKALSNMTARDDEMLHAYSVLRLVFKDLLDANGDLFNTHTSGEIDGVADARRVIYNFSELMNRGKGLAMAQLVNVIGFAVSNLGEGDLVVVHGTENVDERVKKYIGERFEQLHNRGGRTALLYNDVDKMLADQDFNRFDAADWTLLGPMRDITVEAYRKRLSQAIPPDLESLITSRGEKITYLRRGHTNVVFRTDLALGVNPARADRREAARIQAAVMTSASLDARKAPEEPAVPPRRGSHREAPGGQNGNGRLMRNGSVRA